MSLYKYLRPERIDVLANGTISVSRPGERNDPFDELAAVDWGEHSAEGSEFLRASGKHGAICLSRVWDSLAMWSYYADEHRGFVIEFDEEHPAFKEQFGGGVVPIVYGNRDMASGKTNLNVPNHLTIKAPVWVHEQEVRIFYHLHDCAQPIMKDERLIFLTKYPREAVTQVLCGCRMKPCYKEMIQRCLRQWGFKATTLIALSPDPKHFSFVTKELPVFEARA